MIKHYIIIYVKTWSNQLIDCLKICWQHHDHCTQYRDTKIQHGGYSLLKDGLSTPCTLHTIHRYQSTAWWVQPAQRRALDTMYIAHNTQIQNTAWWIQPAQRRALDTMYVHCTQFTDTKIHHGGYSLLKDGLSTPCTLHTIHRYKNTEWWIQPAQRRALDTMYIAHNTQIQKYSLVDTACSKTGSRHHVHCTQYTDTKV